MAVQYDKFYTLTSDAIFRTRLQFALWISARAILTEPVGTPNNAKRVTWAKRELKKDADADQIRIVAINVVTALASGVTAGGEIQDAAIQTVVDGMINEIA